MIAPRACFFPNTDLSPGCLARALLCFREIILYRLPKDQPGPYLASAADKGWLQMVEAGFIEDESELTRLLNEYTRWAEFFHDPKSLAARQSHPREDEMERSGARLMSGIRAGRSNAGPVRDARREAQIFMHFARRLDEQQVEIDHLLTGVDRKEAGLREMMGVETEGPEDEAPRSEAFPARVRPAETRAGLMGRRLTAWAHFYDAFGVSGLPLFTDRPEAVAVLDTKLASQISTGGLVSGRMTDVLEPFFNLILPDPVSSADSPTDLDGLVAQRNENQKWYDFTALIGSKAWSTSELPELRDRAGGVAAEMADVFRQTWHSSKQGQNRVTLTGYLMPGRDLKEAFLSANGLQEGPPVKDLFCGPLFELRVDEGGV